jgi:hypothetical protein
VSIAFWSKFCPVDFNLDLDLFGVPPTQTSVEHGYWEQKGLTSTLTDQGPYEFAVSGAGDDYIDLFHHARQLRFFSRWSVTEKSFYVRPVGIHAGRWRSYFFA